MGSEEDWKKIYDEHETGHARKVIVRALIAAMIMVAVPAAIISMARYAPQANEAVETPVLTAADFNIIGWNGSQVYVKNIGDTPIPEDAIAFYMDDAPVKSENEEIAPGGMASVTIQGLETAKSEVTIKAEGLSVIKFIRINPAIKDMKDTEGPVILASHSPEGIEAGDMMTIDATATDISGTGEIRIFVDDFKTPKVVCDSSRCSYASSYVEGVHDYFVTAKDTLGNVARHTIGATNFEVMPSAEPEAEEEAPFAGDDEPPSLMVSSSLGKSNEVILMAVAKDDSGIKAISVYADEGKGFVRRKSCSVSPCSTVLGPYISSRAIRYYAEAADTKGNKRDSSVSAVEALPATPSVTPVLFVSVSALPPTGTAPLISSVTVDVSGTAAGNIIYKLDCTSDGTWEQVITTASDPYTFSVKCLYASAKTYYAKVQAIRQGILAAGSASVVVKAPASTQTQAPSPDLVIQSVTASPSSPAIGEDITYTVAVKNQGLADSFGGWLDGHISDAVCGVGVPFDSGDMDTIASGTAKTFVLTKRGGFSSGGQHTVWVFADADCKVSEYDENNNKLAYTISVVDATSVPIPAPTPPAAMSVPILVLKYFPLQSGTQNLDPSITGMSDSLDSIREKVGSLTQQGIDKLEAGSVYHGYKDADAAKSLDYYVYDSKEFLSAMPVSTNQIPLGSAFRPDYAAMLNGMNICDYADNMGVRQIWVWGYHYGDIEPAESNMAMGTASQSYWNHGTYGDVSNSEQINDMPTCSKTYTLYNYNYGRGLGELLEDHGHQLESVFSFADSTLWGKFRSPNGALPPTVNHCGWTHSPPNSGDWSGDRGQYDWNDEAGVLSDCEDWKPDGTGTPETVDCHTWYGTACMDNGGVEFKVWWMQNIPGKDNNLMDGTESLRNWWDFYGDFDAALAYGKNLAA